MAASGPPAMPPTGRTSMRPPAAVDIDVTWVPVTLTSDVELPSLTDRVLVWARSVSSVEMVSVAGLTCGAAWASGPKTCSSAPCTGWMTWFSAGTLLALTSRLATDPSLLAWGTPFLTEDADDEQATPTFTIAASWEGSAGVAHF